ncbi:hypothetical protein L596_000830 [Steinernema carpocapsae]|uniref:RING-type domain-containing protein n=1 Tax=Steinernema carpocapsae TaxID=34508 RepID=A0A4U8ULQ1_STECR|nr:hypothetical protein L596_000830 [Steinernema carpocapsae]
MSSYDRLNCPICLDWLDSFKPLYSTECGHVFHSHCLSRAVQASGKCPSCRQELSELRKIYCSTAPFGEVEAQEELEKTYKTVQNLENERKEWLEMKGLLGEFFKHQDAQFALKVVEKRNADLVQKLKNKLELEEVSFPQVPEPTENSQFRLAPTVSRHPEELENGPEMQPPQVREFQSTVTVTPQPDFYYFARPAQPVLLPYPHLNPYMRTPSGYPMSMLPPWAFQGHSNSNHLVGNPVTPVYVRSNSPP